MSVAGGKLAVMEGSVAIARAVQACRPAVVTAYPITPQTHIVEALAQMSACGQLGAEYIRADSEFSAASILAGASAAGVRSYTASSSQGLLLMTEVIYYLAGARLPVVFTGANRQVSAPIGLQPDHQDTISLRDAGIIQLYVENVQEAYDTHIQAFRIAEDHDVLLPVIVCVDGFVLTHVYEPVRIFEQAAIDAFLPPYQPVHYVTPERPMVFGSISDDSNTLEYRYVIEQAMARARDRVEDVAREYQMAFGHYHGGLIDTYRTEDAEIVLVAMGSTVGTLREVVDQLRDEGRRVGLVKVRCFRPFPEAALRSALSAAPGSTRVVAVLDRAISAGYQGVLAGEVKAALYDLPAEHRPLVLGSLAGFGGREVTPEGVREILARAEAALAGPARPIGPHFLGLRPEMLPANDRPVEVMA